MRMRCIIRASFPTLKVDVLRDCDGRVHVT
jgi:hypothetical protein